jgi:3-methyladenine DNA glycosylase AlkD
VLVDLYRRAVDQDKKKIYTLYFKNTKFINNWDLVDASAGRIVGAYVFTRDKKPIYTLAKSENLWERRISIMSTSYFIAHKEFVDTLKIAEMLLNDKEDLIEPHKTPDSCLVM